MLSEDARAVVSLLIKNKMTISAAESCTGGMLCAALTGVPGCSEVLNAGIVTYSNEAKMKYLGVSEETLKKYGAVSEDTALQMSAGVKKANCADIGVGITGIAGPGGGTEEKPVGLVYISVNEVVTKNIFDGNRGEVRRKAVEKALSMVRGYIEENGGIKNG